MRSLRLKHLVTNPVVKVEVDGRGRIDLEDIESRTGALVTDEADRQARTGEGVEFRLGDVLFSKLRPYLRKTLHCPSGGYCSPELLVLRPYRELVEPRFLYYLMLSTPLADWATATSRGAKMPRTDFEALGRFEVTIPPLDEQRHIANLLDAASENAQELVTRVLRGVELLDARDVALIAGKLDSAGGPARRLGQLVRVVSGTGFPHASQGHPEGDLPFVKVSDMHRPGASVWVDGAENWVTADVAAELGARVVPSGSVIFPKVGAAMLKNPRRLTARECIVDNNIMAVIPVCDMSPRFLRFALARVDLAEFANPGPVPSVNEDQVKAVRINLPPRADQERIADDLDERIERNASLRRLLGRHLELLAERQEALITEAVTGGADHPRAAGRDVVPA